MCGFVILGNFSSTALSFNQRDAFQNALVADSARGMDGTGVLRVMREGETRWAKAAGNPFDLFRTENFVSDFWGPITSGWTRWLIGHNRYKTKGVASSKNSHPFQNKHIILAHNGTLRHGSIPEIGKYDVDSEAICASVAERGIDETINQIDSAYCFVYYDTKAKTLNIIRNKERPMYMGVDKKGELIALASESELIDWALMRNGNYIELYEELKEHVLYTWTLDNIVPSQRTVKPIRKKDKKNKHKKSMWINGVEWVDTDGSGVYAINQINDTKPEPKDRRSENNYDQFPHKSAYEWKHSAWCKCPTCKKEETAKILALPAPKKDLGTSFGVESYLGLKKGMIAQFQIDDYEEITKNSDDSSVEKAYVIIGYSSVYKEFTFKTRVKGEDGLKSLIDSDYVQGKIVSILVNKDPGAYIGTCYLSFPEPGWDVKGPAEIPEHAYEDDGVETIQHIYKGEV